MAAAPVIIQLGGQKYVYASDMKVITLTRNASTSAKSLRAGSNVDYQVPVGKLFKGLEFTLTSQVTGSVTAYITDETSANTANPSNMFVEAESTEYQSIKFNCEYDVAAAHYVGVEGVSASALVTLVGIEMDA